MLPPRPGLNFKNLALFFLNSWFFQFLNYFTCIPVDKICVKAVKSQKSEQKAHFWTPCIHGKIVIFSKKMSRPCLKAEFILNCLNSSVLLTKYPVTCHKSDASQSLATECKFSLTEEWRIQFIMFYLYWKVLQISFKRRIHSCFKTWA